MNKFIQFFVKRPLIANVLTVFIFLAGIMMYRRITKQAFPDVEEPGISIVTLYPGAAPEDVELNVTIPIERALKGINGIDKYYSTSYENYSVVWVLFDVDADDYNQIKSDIRRAIDRITDFPEEVTERPTIYDWGGKYAPMLRIGVRGKVKSLTDQELHQRVKELEDRLMESSYVSKIEKNGYRDREIHINVDLKKLNSLYISFDEVIQAIKSHNIQATSGTLKSYTSEKNIVTLSRFKHVTDVKNVIIRSGFSGKKIQLKDIATIEDTFEEQNIRYRFNGNPGILMYIYKKQSNDVVKATKAAGKILDKFRKQYANQLEVAIIEDWAEPTRSRISVVQNNALIGLSLVVLLLFFFMNFKNAFWTSLGIPFSICFALIFLPLFDVTINSVSLLGVIIVLGMIVDDAIVISENIYRHRIEGFSPLEAAIKGASEVGFAVLTTILTTIIVFLPLYFMKGVAGQYAREIPIIIIFILLGSLFESLFILPNHVSHQMKPLHRIGLGLFIGALFFFASIYFLTSRLLYASLGAVVGAIAIAIVFNILFKEKEKEQERLYIEKLRSLYHLILNLALKFRYPLLGFLVFLMVLSFFLVKRLGFELFPAMDATIIKVTGETKGVVALEYTADKIKTIESYIQDRYDSKTMKSFVTVIGQRGHPEQFHLTLYLTPANNRKITADKIMAELKTVIKKTNLFTNLTFDKRNMGEPGGVGNNIRIQVAGNHGPTRKKLTNQVVTDLKSIKGVGEIKRTDRITKPEISIIPKYSDVARYGVTAQKIANVTKIAYDGYVVTHIQTPDEKIPYRILLHTPYRKKIKTLDKLKVLNQQGKLLPVKQMIHIKEDETLTEVQHYNGYRSTTVEADINPKHITPQKVFELLRKKYTDIPVKHKGFRIVLGGGAEMSSEIMNELYSTLAIAIGAVFVLLIFLFKSITQPIMVMLAIPFGFVGVIFAFALHGMPLSFMGVMGIIGLSGVVVNDSLVMVEYINKLRTQSPNINIRELVLKGAITRLRPILLTTLTTFAGLLPTAYGFGGKDAMIMPAAMALGWGLLFATFLTLFIIPMFYCIQVDTITFINRLLPDRFKK
jgi:multidrug efflux pump subunit AcrB